MDTLLLVEDDKMVRQMMKETLEEEGFLILEAAHGKRLLEVLQCHSVDLIVLDLRLPDGSGLDFLSDIRSHTDAPVIILSGHMDRSDQLNGLEGGADDCLMKPLDLDILLAHIHSNLRRYKGFEANQNDPGKAGFSKEAAEKIKFGRWILDRLRFQIFDEQGHPGRLTAREFELLSVLITNAGRAVRRDELCAAIREDRYVPTPRAIDVKITRIRKKIGDDAARANMISTVRGVGYMFNADQVSAP